MKRKKWSELEEKTLLTKYSDLQNSGTLSKLKTREKKFKPIADHVNSTHHLLDPTKYPFKWTWRDVSIKVQNMRHQYLGVKQKIRISDGEFNWDDGENHWENFLMYRDVFGDVELEMKRVLCDGGGDFSSNVNLDGFEFELDCDVGFDEGGEEVGGSGLEFGKRVLELREVLVRREEKRKEREEDSMSKEVERREREWLKEERVREVEERVEGRELELEEMRLRWERRRMEREMRLERELEDEKRWRMKVEEKREEEQMEWRERMLGLQLDHEKQMMQIHADACQNQMQVMGIMARFMCQFFGSVSDGLGGGLGGLHPQVLQSLQQQHPGAGDLGDNSKPGSDSPPEFM